MACAFTMAALKKEADVYVSQGLYQEALDLYGGFLGRAATLDSRLRQSIEAAMDQIKVRMNTFQADEDHLLSDPAIKRIKKGWRGSGSHTEVLVSARTLKDIGLYGAALAEYRELLVKKHMTAEVAQGVTDCLAHLVQPEQFAQSIDLLVGDIFQFPKNILMFKLLIARNVDTERHPHHFEALYRHLARIEQVPADLEKHIRSLEGLLKNEVAGDTDDDAYGPVDGLDVLYGAWTRSDKPSF